MSRLQNLVKDSHERKPFSELPTSHQLAIIWWMAVDGDSWNSVNLSSFLTTDDIKSNLVILLPEYIKNYGDVEFSIGLLKTEDIINSVMQDEDIADSFSSWNEYHEWYSSGEMPKHPKEDRWPIFLSSDDYETIMDGWHRFHSYVKDGDLLIPVIF